ncbi:MAG: transcriptional regulator [Hadesarchaea archaeon DG-33]|nr:MAG: transcriptional regulator [Hadesarchaea archaeon DG-33]
MAVPRFWREIPNRYNLVGARCGNCNKILFPPRSICPFCRRMGKLEPYRLKRKGKVFSYTVVHVAAEGFEDQVPYVLAIIELEDGPSLTAQITDCNPDEVKIGDEVEMVFRRMGEESQDGVIYYGFKGRLIKP